MGRFVNPDNSAFQVALNSEIYVDKTELIAYTNKVLNTKQALICNSRPRRFGKSVTADMLTAYYSKGCDSEALFSGFAISEDASFQKHLNRYDVIHFDVQWCCMDAEGADRTAAYINHQIIKELKEIYPAYIPDDTQTAYGAMSCIHAAAGSKFIVIIDEWDALIRDEEASQAVQEDYISFLRGLFKGTEPTKFIQLAYLTGILPIKKLRTQSALNNFSQFTMLSPGPLAPYFGFTEDEVKTLCKKYHKNFDEVKRWYDGYQLGDLHVYNPNAVVCLMQEGSFQSYWSQTGTYEMIVPLINRDFDGLKTAFIPNEEIRQEFAAATRRKKWSALVDFQRESENLLDATLDMDGETVARGIEKIHMEYASVIQYHDENSLSSVLTIAYLSTMQYYFKPIRELPTGRGFADFVFVPKTEYVGEYPALLVELKWNRNAMTALRQIRDKQYPSVLEAYTGDILLVGISYDKKTKTHECVMEMLQK